MLTRISSLGPSSIQYVFKADAAGGILALGSVKAIKS